MHCKAKHSSEYLQAGRDLQHLPDLTTSNCDFGDLDGQSAFEELEDYFRDVSSKSNPFEDLDGQQTGVNDQPPPPPAAVQYST